MNKANTVHVVNNVLHGQLALGNILVVVFESDSSFVENCLYMVITNGCLIKSDNHKFWN